MERILYVNGGSMDNGGISAFMMNYYRHIDRKKFQIDFVVHGFEEGIHDSEILGMGGRIYHIPVKSKDLLGNLGALYKIFRTRRYRIVHAHMDAMNIVVLWMAKICGIPVRISHSHNTEHLLKKGTLHYWISEQAKKRIRRYATQLCACSDLAGEWLYGKSGDYKVIKNAIPIEKYAYSEKLRDEVRSAYQIRDDEIVLGNVGRFHEQKNHAFLIEVFRALKRQDSYGNLLKLMLIGDGSLQDEIKEQVKAYGMESDVLFLGNQDEPGKFYSAMDIYMMPSLFEGLGIAVVEAQANGLRCFLSSNIPREVDCTDRIEFLELDCGKWTEAVSRMIELGDYRRTAESTAKSFEQVRAHGYDIRQAARELEEYYYETMRIIL